MPRDFKNKSFQRVLRGYAPEEVEEYIAYINEEYRKLERRTADSERKLALALKKLDENAKNGAVDSVGPAAREAASKLLRDAEAKSAEIIAEAEKKAVENTERIEEEARTRAEQTVGNAVAEAEAIITEAKREAEMHRDDVKKARDTAHEIYGEVDSFREKLYALYNEHLDALEGVTENAKSFIASVDEKAPADPDTEPEVENESEENAPDTEVTEIIDEEVDLTEGAELSEEEVSEEEYEVSDDIGEEDVTDEEARDEAARDEVADNIAFMDKIFASSHDDDGENAKNDLYVDIPEEDEEELPPIMIDWKNRSAVSADEVSPEDEAEDASYEETAREIEERDFRSADGFDEIDDEYIADDNDVIEENYDEYSPDDTVAEEQPEEYEDEDDDEADEYRDMDKIFNEDKSKRDMSLTDEFNIIFDDSKSSQNVKEISRQPIIAPEAPKNAKKHKKF